MSITLALVGDVNCKADEGCEPELAPSVVEQLAQADVCIGNLEGALADPSVELHYKAGWFDCEPEMLSVVQPYFDAFGCANNVQFGKAIATSNRHLDRAGILHTGAAATRAEARRPHVVQGVEVWMDRPIFYSLGNFMFGWRLHREATRDGLLVHLSAGGERPWRCLVVPVRRNDRNEVEALALDTPHGARIAGRLAELSAPFGTGFVPGGYDGLLVQPGRAAATAA